MITMLDHWYNKDRRIDFVFHSETALHLQTFSVLQCQPVSFSISTNLHKLTEQYNSASSHASEWKSSFPPWEEAWWVPCAQKRILSTYSQDLCDQRNQNNFRKLVLLVSSSIVSTFEDLFSYHNVLMYFFFFVALEWSFDRFW